MSSNILITGAAGYIGGSVVVDLVSGSKRHVKPEQIYAAVRTDEQVRSLDGLGVNAIKLDLGNQSAVRQAVLEHKIDVIVHTASSFDAQIASYLIEALGERRRTSGEETYFIHSSVANIYSPEAGWPFGEISDTGPVFEKEKESSQFPIQKVNIHVIETAKAHGVTSFIVSIPTVYGTGSGTWRKLSSNIPAMVRASIKQKVVYKFDEDSYPALAHISDLAALYILLVDKILQGKQIPSNEKGYYFAMAHTISWHKIMDGLAETLHSKGLVSSPEPKKWPSDEMAAEELGFPVQLVRTMGTNKVVLKAENAFEQLGWQPKWNADRMLGSLGEEIDAIEKYGSIKTTMYDSLK